MICFCRATIKKFHAIKETDENIFPMSCLQFTAKNNNKNDFHNSLIVAKTNCILIWLERAHFSGFWAFLVNIYSIGLSPGLGNIFLSRSSLFIKLGFATWKIEPRWAFKTAQWLGQYSCQGIHSLVVFLFSSSSSFQPQHSIEPEPELKTKPEPESTPSLIFIQKAEPKKKDWGFQVSSNHFFSSSFCVFKVL